MSAFLDLHPDGTHPVLSGVDEIEAALERMLASPTMELETGDYAAVVTGLERISRRLDAVKLRMLAAADKTEAARAAGFTDTGAWVAKQATVSRAEAARRVALATELESGHDATSTGPGGRAGLDPTCRRDRARHRTAAHRGERRAAAGGGGKPGRAGSALQPRPVPSSRAPSGRSSRNRQDRGRCPRERARPLRGASSAGQVLTDAARQRRRHHDRALHRPRFRRRDPGQGPGHDDRAPTHARTSQDPEQVVRLAAPPRARVRRASRAPAHRPPAQQDGRHRGRHHRPHRPGRRHEGRGAGHRGGPLSRRGPNDSPATLRSCPRCSAAGPSLSTSAGKQDCSPPPNASPPACATTPVPPPGANAPTPGASCTTGSLGRKAGAPTSTTRSRCAIDTTSGSTTTAFTTSSCPTAA